MDTKNPKLGDAPEGIPSPIATPGRQALVVDPVVEGTRLTKVLMDGGSGLNILLLKP